MRWKWTSERERMGLRTLRPSLAQRRWPVHRLCAGHQVRRCRGKRCDPVQEGPLAGGAGREIAPLQAAPNPVKTVPAAASGASRIRMMLPQGSLRQSIDEKQSP